MGTKYLTDGIIDEICTRSHFDEMDVFMAISVNDLPDEIRNIPYPEREHYLDQMVMDQFYGYEIRDSQELIELLSDFYPWLKQTKVFIEFISNWRENFANEYGNDPWTGYFLVSRINLHVEASIMVNEDFDDDSHRISKPMAIDSLSRKAAWDYYKSHNTKEVGGDL